MTISSAQKVRKAWTAITVIVVLGTAASAPIVRAQGLRPMTFLDMRLMRTVGIADAEPGRPVAALHAVDAGLEGSQEPDRPLPRVDGSRASLDAADDLHEGEERNVAALGARRPGFFFLSNREAPESASSRNQIYLMRPDGGEAQRITDTKEGVRDYRVSRDGRWLVYRTGKDGRGTALSSRRSAASRRATAEQLTKHPTGVGTLAVDARQQAHLLRDARTRSTRTRRSAARRSSPSTSATRRRPSASLWALDLDPIATKKLSDGDSVCRRRHPSISDDGKWMAFRGSRSIATSATSPPKASTPISTCSTRPPATSSG